MDKDIAEGLQEENNGTTQVVSDEAADVIPEKMLPASRVTELIKKAKWEGEKKMQEQLEQAKQQIEQLQSGQGQQQAPVQQQQQPQQPGMSPEQIQAQIMQKVQEELQKKEEMLQQQQLQREVDQVAQQYYGKMNQGRTLYEDFDAITADFNPAEFPQLVFLANQVDNTADVIYELSKKPGKLAELQTLLERSPNMARKQIANLSESIKTNQDAKNGLQEPQEPLNRMKPSPAGTDNGDRTVRDYKKSSFLKV